MTFHTCSLVDTYCVVGECSTGKERDPRVELTESGHCICLSLRCKTV